jgi:hypothetical protein
MIRGSGPDLGGLAPCHEKSGRLLFTTAVITMFVSAVTPQLSIADEGGVSFWLPGTFGSLAAVPGQPGWSFATFGYNTNVSAGANVAAAREIEIGALNPTLRANLSATLHADVAFDFSTLDYVFATPVLGGQLSLAMGGLFGQSTADVNGTLTASLGPFIAGRPLNIDSGVTGFGDLSPQAYLK